MKKLFVIVMLCIMSFVGSNLFAQNEKVVIDTSLVFTQAMSEEVSAEEPLEPGSRVLTMNDLESIADLLNNAVGDTKQNMLGNGKDVYVPAHKRRKINGHHICQRLELSILADRSETSKDLANKLFGGVISGDGGSPGGDSGGDGDLLKKLDNKTGGLGIGANFGYSLVFVPGYIEEGSDQLLLNRFGFGYSIGLISQFDHEKESGVTWDFLAKVGGETGFNKAIGVGFDLLFGGGKTSQTVVDFGAVDFDNPNPDDLEVSIESLWCAKAGTQLWLRLNFLTKGINNFDTALFSRFIYSFRPYSEEQKNNRLINYSELPVWQNEAWSFGFTMTYFF